MAAIQLSVLGIAQVQHQDQTAVRFRTNKVLALFVYLAIERKTHLRETLATLLWPEQTSATARRNLSQSLSRLRRSLGDSSDSSPYFELSRRSVALSQSAAVESDYDTFLSLMQATKAHSHSDLAGCSPCIERLERAVALIRGDFLAGVALDDSWPFEEWLLLRREEIHRKTLDALEALMQAAMQGRQYAAAQRYARRQLALEPWRETAHRQLMRALALNGERASAIAQFERCKAVLQQELSVTPSPATVELAKGIETNSLDAERLEHDTFPRHNLPTSLTPFIGREETMQQIGERLQAGSARLLTIVGPGGIGKSRFALHLGYQLLNSFEDGIWLVSLAAVESVDGITAALAEALNLNLAGDRADLMQIYTFLQQRSLLLILDNFEHLLDGATLVLDLLSRAHDVVVVATSREPLKLHVEDIYRLDGLPTPALDATVAEACSYPAVRLFLERARRLDKSFDATEENIADIIAICTLLAGSPLAIELAVTWICDFSCAEIAQEIATDIDFLTTSARDVPAQHRSMRAVFDYSWRLLSPEAQQMLARLSAFHGAFDHSAARQIAGAKPALLRQFRAASMLGAASVRRYSMHPLMRQFSAEHLAPDDPVRARHSAYYLNLVAAQTEQLYGLQPVVALQAIRKEIDNIRQAWRWATANDSDRLVAAGRALSRYWAAQGLHLEAEQSLRQAIEAAGDDQARLTLLREIVLHATWQGNLVTAEKLALEALALAKSAGSEEQIAWATMRYAVVLEQQGHGERAKSRLQALLDLQAVVESDELRLEVLDNLGRLADRLGDQQSGRRYLLEALELARKAGNRAREQSILLYVGVNYTNSADYRPARHYLGAALELIDSTGDRTLEARIVNALGFTLAQMKRFSKALPLHERSRLLAHQSGQPFQESHAYHNICTVKRKMGDLDGAEAAGLEALRLAHQFDLRDPESYAYLHLGYVWLTMGTYDAALDAFGRSRRGWQQIKRDALATEAHLGIAAVKLELGEFAAARQIVDAEWPALADGIPAGTDEPDAMRATIRRVLSTDNALADRLVVYA